MTLHFELSPSSAGVQTVFLILRQAGNKESVQPMHALHNDLWQAEWSCRDMKVMKFSYRYLLHRENHIQTEEEPVGRSVCWQPGDPENIYLSDRWNDPSVVQNTFLRAPFTKTLFLNKHKKKQVNAGKYFTHEFRVLAPWLPKEEAVCLLGNIPALQSWDTRRPLIMQPEGHFWTARVIFPKNATVIEYKYGIYQTDQKKFQHYEAGENRIFLNKNSNNSRTIISDNFFRSSQLKWRGAGVAIPVFSLRSEASVGIGEFTDLKLLTDWAAKSGLKLLQILPVNDTTATHTWYDSYPYAAISAFALNPAYINLKAIGSLPEKHPAERKYTTYKERFNLLSEINYEAVLKFKWEYLRGLYEIYKDDFLNNKLFKFFFRKHKSWLIPYAVFCYLRDRHGTADYSRFGRYKIFDLKNILKLASPIQPHFDEIAIHYFVQYHLHCQLSDATKYAHSKGVVLKGDIPIGIYRHSIEAWMYPEYFFLDMQAGAPPDAFAVKGQNWGFPTYQWEKMEADGFSWWKKRLQHLSLYFDAIRFDHILGFFRIWEIPADAVEGIMGHFHPAIPVTPEELHGLNIHFDKDRFCKPFITQPILNEFFGPDAPFIIKTFLDKITDERYQLKTPFNTQRKIAAFFDDRERDTNTFPGHWKLGLFDLRSNVLFLPADENGNCFHPRFGLMNTTSFSHLSMSLQQKLRRLHDDYFYGRQENFWQTEAMRKLPALKYATEMLVCGEDLGMIPQSVPKIMQALGLLSLEVQRMPKESSREFTSLRHVPYLSVVTPGTHDMSTLREWWEEDRERTQRFYNQVLKLHGAAPYFCEPWVVKQIIEQHLQSSAMWAIVQLQDFLSMSARLRRGNPHDERINIPANPNHYWRYRMHITLEQLLKENTFNEMIQEMTNGSGRNSHI